MKQSLALIIVIVLFLFTGQSFAQEADHATEKKPIYFTNNLLFKLAGEGKGKAKVKKRGLSCQEKVILQKARDWAISHKATLATPARLVGDPEAFEAFGYIHENDHRAILTARNIQIRETNLLLTIFPTPPGLLVVKNLVVEQVYPYRMILPDLYAPGDKLDIPLKAFETVVYEIYPLPQATTPLFAGLPFDARLNNDGKYELNFYGFSPNISVLNPDLCTSTLVNETEGLKLQDLPQPRLRRPVLQSFELTSSKDSREITLSLTSDSTDTEATVGFWFVPEKDFIGKEFNPLSIQLDGKESPRSVLINKGIWFCYLLKPGPGTHTIRLTAPNDAPAWQGSVEVWFLCKSPAYKQTISFSPKTKFKDRIMPPLPMGQGIQEHQFELGIKEIIMGR